MPDDVSDSDSDVGEDNVKVMPRIEERSQRAMIKKNLREPSKERSKADIIQDDESDENGGDDDSADEHEYFDEVVDSERYRKWICSHSLRSVDLFFAQ